MKTIFRLTVLCALLAGVCFGEGPGGLIIQTQNNGTPSGTFKKFFVLNCVSGLNCTVSGSTLSITVTGGGTGTVTASGGPLTANALVLGAGTTDTKVAAGLTTDGTSKLTLGVASTTAGFLSIAATAGTNGIATIGVGNGANSNAFTFCPASATCTATPFAAIGNPTGLGGAGGLEVQSGGGYGFASTATAFGTIDTALTRDSAGVIDVGTGAAASKAGSMNMTNLGVTGTATIAVMANQYGKWEACNGKGLGDGLNAIPAGTYLQFACVNDTGVTVTITGIRCWTDNAGTSTLQAANNAASNLLTGAVTCNATKASGGAAGTQSGTTTLANGDAISFTFVADGTSKQTNWTVSGTY